MSPRNRLDCYFRPLFCLIGCISVFHTQAVAQTTAPQYDIGGPLAGLKLPPFDRGQTPELLLYPGSVEHYRSDYLRYIPTRSIFDEESMLKNWVAPALPGAESKPTEQFAPPVYPIGPYYTKPATGQFEPAAPVIRFKVLDPVIKLDLGELEPGLYAVRVIAAVETAKLRDWRVPDYMTLRVNDGLGGETNSYRVSIGYTDAFYSVAEIYFHAPERRRFQAELFLDKGSPQELLVHNITLDDVLAGSVRRAIKTRQTLLSPEDLARIKAQGQESHASEVKALAARKPLTHEERMARDAAIWRWLPPINSQGSLTENFMELSGGYPSNTTIGSNDKTMPEIETEFGKWESGAYDDDSSDAITHLGLLNYDPNTSGAFLVNKKLGLSYTYSDLWEHKPLPDPYPYKDDGSGLFFPDPKDPKKGRLLDIIAAHVGARYRNGITNTAADRWIQSGNDDIGHDAAMSLIRFAYQFPTLDDSYYFYTLIGGGSRDFRFRQRMSFAYWQTYQAYPSVPYVYDKLFPYIQGNEDLAASVHRFVPWVHTSKDVIQLLDVYLLQHQAKLGMRFHYGTFPSFMAECAAALGDRNVTEPWMEWLFTKTFEYPLKLAGLQDLMIVGSDRNGPQYIGSAYYAEGEGAAPAALGLEPYIASGGNPKYNLGDATLYPKPLAHCYWRLNTIVGGMDQARIGDVNGPDKSPGRWADNARWTTGWKWSGDPVFAWFIVNLDGRTNQTDTEWAKIQAAAATIKRAPYLDLHSRQLYNWFGVQQSGTQHDDYRFRRAAYVRTGLGAGHEHNDTLDLQILAHGLPMTIDGGQRREGYAQPGDRFSRVHNVVEVDDGGSTKEGAHTQSWVQTISDVQGARYMQTNAMPPAGASLFRRQTALIDVDEGQGSQPLPIAQQKPGAKLPADVTTGNSYVFDVFRVAGGNVHTYCFHGPLDDDFTVNALNSAQVTMPITPQAGAEAQYLSLFTGSKKFVTGDAPDTLEATWRQTRGGNTARFGTEQQMLGVNYDEKSPRKFTTLHLLDSAGLRALQAESVCSKWDYRFTCLMAQKRGTNLESAFPAIIEPYVGEPFLTTEKLLPIDNNEADARRAVAVEVATKNGHDDICFADGRPDKLRILDRGLRIAGEFGYYSTDAQGLRQASLTGGTLLEGPQVRLETAQRERTGKVTSVDYLKKTFQIDAPWPTAAAGRVFEIGTPDRTTSYTSTKITPNGNGSSIGLAEGADYYRSQVASVDPATGLVSCNLAPTVGTIPGLDKGWIASNEQRTKFWRVTKMNGSQFWLDAPVTQADFAPSNALRLWEYGVGDTVRQSTFVSLRRITDNSYELTGDTEVTLTMKGGKIEFSSDSKTWRTVPGKQNGNWIGVKIGLDQLPSQPVFVRAN